MTETNFQFPSTLRLKKAAEFKRVFDNPLKSTDQYFTLLATRNTLGHPRIGLAIAKKAIKKAVHRNLLKRIIRESFRQHQHTLNGIDIVVLARRNADEADTKFLHKSLEKHWLRFNAKCEQS